MKEGIKVTVSYAGITTTFNFKCVGYNHDDEYVYKADESMDDLSNEPIQYVSKYRSYRMVRECMGDIYELVEMIAEGKYKNV